MTAVAEPRPVDGVRTRRFGFRLRRRHLWLVPGLGLALLASQQATQLGAGLVPLLVFGIAPDLPRLAGIGRGHAPGQLPPRAVPFFNAMHHPIVPVALLLGLAVTGPVSSFLLVGAFAWLGHVVVGFGTGDRLRTADGYVRGPADQDRRPNQSTRGAEHQPSEASGG